MCIQEQFVRLFSTRIYLPLYIQYALPEREADEGNRYESLVR